MDVTMDALGAFVARAGIACPSELVGVDLDRWRDARLDLELIQEVHRAVVGDRESVRRVLADGSSVLAPAQPGHVRTKPQGFRSGEHVEPAWEQGALKSGLTRLCRDIAPLLAREPVRAASHLVWALSRAQPFTGMNERVALVLASWVLRRAGLPALDVVHIERDATFGDVLVAAGESDRSDLERYVAGACWDELLALVEAVAPVPPQDAQRWSLADDYAAASEARARAVKISVDELGAFADHVSMLIEREIQAALAITLEPARREWLESHASRMACAWDSAARGRRISPHEPMVVTRWCISNGSGLELKLVIGAAGRGMTGAASAHIALEFSDQPVASRALAMLLVPDENCDDRHARAAAWLARATTRAVEQCPLRI